MRFDVRILVVLCVPWLICVQANGSSEDDFSSSPPNGPGMSYDDFLKIKVHQFPPRWWRVEFQRQRLELMKIVEDAKKEKLAANRVVAESLASAAAAEPKRIRLDAYVTTNDVTNKMGGKGGNEQDQSIITSADSAVLTQILNNVLATRADVTLIMSDYETRLVNQLGAIIESKLEELTAQIQKNILVQIVNRANEKEKDETEREQEVEEHEAVKPKSERIKGTWGKFVDSHGKRFANLSSSSNESSCDNILAKLSLIEKETATILSHTEFITQSVADQLKYYMDNSSSTTARDCAEREEQLRTINSDNWSLEARRNATGVHQIWPTNLAGPIMVFCDFVTGNGGWTVIQSRVNGVVSFYRDWVDYKNGFGSVNGDHWLGLEPIYRLTNQAIYEMRVELENFEGEQREANYAGFAIGSEEEDYQLKVLGKYRGNAGDSMTYHAGMKFSTHDRDNDLWAGDSCAKQHMAGWWYNHCESANLNGLYLNGYEGASNEYRGIFWAEWMGPNYSLKRVQIKIRPVKQIEAKTETRNIEATTSNLNIEVIEN